MLVDPERVTITGPQAHVKLVDAVTTDPVDASGTQTSATFATNVYVADALVQVVQPTPVRVTVIVTLPAFSLTEYPESLNWN